MPCEKRVDFAILYDNVLKTDNFLEKKRILPQHQLMPCEKKVDFAILYDVISKSQFSMTSDGPTLKKLKNP